MTDFAFPDSNPAQRRLPLGVVTSVGLHVAVFLAALLASPLRQLVVPPPQPVAVEIVTPQEFAALETPTASNPALTAPDAAEEFASPKPGERLVPSGPLEPKLLAGKTITATQFFAGELLKRPDMQRIRNKLTTFADSERMVQVCDIEAIEQIKHSAAAYDPDTVVPYAMGDPLWNGLLFIAPSGAFRSRRRWYELAFHCTVAPGYEAVTAFDFTVGAPIPEAEWEEHSLNAEDADDD